MVCSIELDESFLAGGVAVLEDSAFLEEAALPAGFSSSSSSSSFSATALLTLGVAGEAPLPSLLPYLVREKITKIERK